MKRKALLSLSDKSGLVDFATRLIALDFELISTGGTAAALREAGLSCVDVSDVTGFPECLDGRVKTLHPAIHAGLLVIRDNEAHMQSITQMGIEPIDLLAVNLYPFRATIEREGVTLEQAIENIDIGGPTMLRAAAKNYRDVVVVVDPADYECVLEGYASGTVPLELRAMLARKVFAHTAAYDALISHWLNTQAGDSPIADTFTRTYEKVQDLRYGENPHQSAAFYREVGVQEAGTLSGARQLQGKELSFNNINDAEGALRLLQEFEQPTAVAVKHANPCGVGMGADVMEAYTKAHDADPVSIFGGIVAVNGEIDEQLAERLSEVFLEIIIAPRYSDRALEVLGRKKNLRLLEMPCLKTDPTARLDIRTVAGGLLVQTADDQLYEDSDLHVVTKRSPTQEEMDQMRFAFTVVKHTKSNAIVLVKDYATVGIGPGQMNRVTSLDIAVRYAEKQAIGAVMASDAFFPFPDCVEAAYVAGITAIIQPGGSLNDQQSIDKADEYGIAMVFTGMRHFKH